MGGTSTDVALISDELELSTHHEIINLPITTPMLPIETVGAGGGSIAFVDSGGILKVGPESPVRSLVLPAMAIRNHYLVGSRRSPMLMSYSDT